MPRLLALSVLVVTLSVLSAQAPPELVISVGHSSRPSHAVFAGRYLATAMWSPVALIDLSTGLTVAHLQHAGHVTTMEASPAEDVIAVGTCGRSVELWDVNSRRLLRRITVKRECVDSVSFSPDGTLIAIAEVGCLTTGDCCSPYGAVQIWDVRSGTLKRELGKELGIRQVIFGKNGRWLAGADDKGKTTVFEWPSGRRLHTFGGAGDVGSPGSGLSSPDGKYLAWQWSHRIQVWDVVSRTRIQQVEGTAGEFLNDARLAYVDDNRLRIVTLPNGPVEEMPLEKPREEWTGDVGITIEPEWLRIHRSGRTIAGTFDSRTVLWDTNAAKLRDLTSPVLTTPESLHWNRSGIVAWSDRGSDVWAWSEASGQPLEPESDEAGNVLAFDEEARQLADSLLEKMMIARGRKHTNVAHAALSPDKRWIAAGLQGNELTAVTVWPAAGGDDVTLDSSGSYGPQPPAFSSDSRRIATFSKGTSLMVWLTRSWKLERVDASWHWKVPHVRARRFPAGHRRGWRGGDLGQP